MAPEARSISPAVVTWLVEDKGRLDFSCSEDAVWASMVFFGSQQAPVPAGVISGTGLHARVGMRCVLG